jgi:transcriptional regulator with XRE-family HTH domain
MTLLDEVRARRLPSAKTRRAIRLAANVSQLRMASELGVHRTTFIRWENGKQEPRGPHRERYARLLADLQQVSA